MKYYAVQNCYYDDGKIISKLINVIEADTKPENTFSEARRCDIYVDWFNSHEAAMDFIEESKQA